MKNIQIEEDDLYRKALESIDNIKKNTMEIKAKATADASHRLWWEDPENNILLDLKRAVSSIECIAQSTKRVLIALAFLQEVGADMTQMGGFNADRKSLSGFSELYNYGEMMSNHYFDQSSSYVTSAKSSNALKAKAKRCIASPKVDWALSGPYNSIISVYPDIDCLLPRQMLTPTSVYSVLSLFSYGYEGKCCYKDIDSIVTNDHFSCLDREIDDQSKLIDKAMHKHKDCASVFVISNPYDICQRLLDFEACHKHPDTKGVAYLKSLSDVYRKEFEEFATELKGSVIYSTPKDAKTLGFIVIGEEAIKKFFAIKPVIEAKARKAVTKIVRLDTITAKAKKAK